jgi:hypothetical protein
MDGNVPEIQGIDTDVVNVYIKNGTDLLKTCVKCLEIIWEAKKWPVSDIYIVAESFSQPIEFVVTQIKGKKTKVYLEYTLNSTKVFLYPKDEKSSRILIMNALLLPEFVLKALFNNIVFIENNVVLYNIIKEVKYNINLLDASIHIEYTPIWHSQSELENWVMSFYSTSDPNDFRKNYMEFMNS